MAGIDDTSIMVREELAGAGQTINQKALAIADELARLRSQIALVLETYTGDSASLFAPYMQEWNTAAEGLLGPNGILGEIAMVMQVNWNNYSEAEWANIQTWQQH